VFSWPTRLTVPCFSSFSRVSHIYVACRSVCDWYQNQIKAINIHFSSWSRDQDELWATNINQSTFLQTLRRQGYISVPWTYIKLSDQKLQEGANNNPDDLHWLAHLKKKLGVRIYCLQKCLWPGSRNLFNNCITQSWWFHTKLYVEHVERLHVTNITIIILSDEGCIIMVTTQ